MQALGQTRGAAGRAREIHDLGELAEFLDGAEYLAFGEQHVLAMESELEALAPERRASRDGIALRRRIADQYLRRGEFEPAIAQLEAARETALALGLPPDELNAVTFQLGLAHMRHGESLHCLAMCNRERCLLPTSALGSWSNREPAERALTYFEEVLRRDSTDVHARWLFYVAHMSAGTPEESLPPRFRARGEFALGATREAPRFQNVAPELGLDTLDLCGGALLDDLDGDGNLDVVTSSYQPDQPLTYHHNNGDGTFENWTERAGLADQVGGFNLVQTDYDNDGRLDLFVTRGAWMNGEWGRIRNSLLHQNPDGSFTDVTQVAGLDGPAAPSLSGAWADYDLDGDLDLYVPNQRLEPGTNAPGNLFRNEGDGTFRDVAAAAGVTNDRFGKTGTWGDYDNDGDPDLFVANYRGANRLYRNEGEGRFTDVAPGMGLDRHGAAGMSFSSWFFDANNDGWLDLFVCGFAAEFRHAVSDYLNLPADDADKLKLYLNDGRGRLVDVSKEQGLDRAFAVMGANFGDIDNDGYLDVYLGTGAPPFEHLVPNVLLRNVGGERFEDVTAAARVGHLQKGHGIAFGDLDNDGDQDILAQLGGFVKDDRFYNALFENPGNGNSWVTLKLVGTTSNRPAFGARVRVVAATPTGPLEVHRVVGPDGSFGASSLQQEIGLGKATRIVEIVVDWPRSGTQQRFEDLDVNQSLRITEGEEAPETIERSVIELPDPEAVGE